MEGRTSVNHAMLTCESKPVEKGQKDGVIAGSVNGETAVTVEVKKTGEESYLSRVVDMVKKAQESRSRTQDLANRAAVWLTIAALGVGGTTFAAWMLAGMERLAPEHLELWEHLEAEFHQTVKSIDSARDCRRQVRSFPSGARSPGWENTSSPS